MPFTEDPYDAVTSFALIGIGDRRRRDGPPGDRASSASRRMTRPSQRRIAIGAAIVTRRSPRSRSRSDVVALAVVGVPASIGRSRDWASSSSPLAIAVRDRRRAGVRLASSRTGAPTARRSTTSPTSSTTSTPSPGRSGRPAHRGTALALGRDLAVEPATTPRARRDRSAAGAGRRRRRRLARLPRGRLGVAGGGAACSAA